ncbi:MAG TPA: CPBP family intramembrane glutamic endopeptidase [Ignavibacteriaceae bacterium]|nr:CPBP family intramembrane glutamic endopeptidase [Ignavibacteriaceae bacterium]
MKNFKLKAELDNLGSAVKTLDKKSLAVFVSVAVLQTISWYFTSRRFFRIYFFEDLQFNRQVYLIEYLYWFFGDFFTFFLIPILIIKFLLKEQLRNYGLKLGDYKAGILISLIFLCIMIPIVWFVSSFPQFSSTYPHLPEARDSWNTFLVFEFGMIVYMFAWEFIWRGFMLFGLKEKFGYYAVLIQMLPFVILHNGKPAPETFGAIIAGIALGILALRTGSIFYGVIAHYGVMFSIDFISTLRYRAGDFGIGFNSLVKIISTIF